VALLYGAAGTFPKAVAQGAREHAARLGFSIVIYQPYPESDLIGLVQTLTALRPDLILGVGITEADLAFARAARRQGLSFGLIALVAAPIEHFGDALGPGADGFCGPSQWEPILRGQPDVGPTSAQFAASFRERFGVEPDYPAAQAYAAGLVAAECVRRAGSLDDAALRQAAGDLDLTTFYGRFRLDPATGQQVGHQLVVVQWQIGRKQIVWPPNAATADLQLPVPTAVPTPSPSEDSPS
jgi:branched-chain amino acid transport system substrate-binding protein